MAYVRFKGGPIGKEYNGIDGDVSVKIKKGFVAEVSDNKSEQLMRDFEGQFERVSPEEAAKETQALREKDLQDQAAKSPKPKPEPAKAAAPAQPEKSWPAPAPGKPADPEKPKGK